MSIVGSSLERRPPASFGLSTCRWPGRSRGEVVESGFARLRECRPAKWPAPNNADAVDSVAAKNGREERRASGVVVPLRDHGRGVCLCQAGWRRRTVIQRNPVRGAVSHPEDGQHADPAAPGDDAPLAVGDQLPGGANFDVVEEVGAPAAVPATAAVPAAASSSSPPKAASSSWRDRTPDRLRLVRPDDEVFVFAPLECRPLDGDRWPVSELSDRGVLAPVTPPAGRSFQPLGLIAGWSAGVLFVGASLLTGEQPDRQAWVYSGAVMVWLAVLSVSVLVMSSGGRAAGQQTAQLAILLLVVAISVGVPAAVAGRFGPAGGWSATTAGGLAEALQVVFVAVACMTPGLLFFFFDRQRLSTLRARFEQQIFRLDPTVSTLADVEARFGRQLEETYGDVGDRAESRLVRQRRWPIVLATVTLVLGWTVTLPPVGDTAGGVFTPEPNPVAFGFLGAYFFAINLVLRRYARGDLRPKAYSAITVRVLLVIILGWLVTAVVPAPPPWVLVAAFVIGIVPETFFTFVREVYRGRLVARLTNGLQEILPLQELEGIDLYDRSRLMDEGITNVEALAHHDLVDLLLETRIPAARLVDWVDQAVLYLHVVQPATDHARDPVRLTVRGQLRGLGIRTATDLETVAAALARCPEHSAGALGLRDLRRAVTPPGDDDGGRLEVLLHSLRDDEWLPSLRNWRRQPLLHQRTIHLDDTGRILTDERVAVTSATATPIADSSTAFPVSMRRTPPLNSGMRQRRRRVGHAGTGTT